MPALVWTVKYFSPYIYGSNFVLVIGHTPLQWVFGIKDPVSRLMRWIVKLQEYDYEIIHKSGKRDTNADALSRIEINLTMEKKVNQRTEDEKKEILRNIRIQLQEDIKASQGLITELN